MSAPGRRGSAGGPNLTRPPATIGISRKTLISGMQVPVASIVMAHRAEALPDPVVIVIDDEFSAWSDDEIAVATAALLDDIASGPTVDLGDIDIAELIRQERADRGG